MSSKYKHMDVVVVFDRNNSHFPWGIFTSHKKATRAIKLWGRSKKEMQISFVLLNYRLHSYWKYVMGIESE